MKKKVTMSVTMSQQKRNKNEISRGHKTKRIFKKEPKNDGRT